MTPAFEVRSTRTKPPTLLEAGPNKTWADFLMMSLRSLKEYLTGRDEVGTLRRIVSILLQGITLHAVEGDRADYARFRDHLERIQAPLGKRTSAQDLLIAAGATNQALAEHGQRTTRFIRQQGAILQNMISM
jgi:predicted nucleic acid-binding protein